MNINNLARSKSPLSTTLLIGFALLPFSFTIASACFAAKREPFSNKEDKLTNEELQIEADQQTVFHSNINGRYIINPGDGLSVFVWNEESISVPQILVRPDGFVSLPIVGEVMAGGQTIQTLSEDIAKKLNQFLKDEPVVTVSLIGLGGNSVYVLGKVARPGKYVMESRIDVAQALAMAGGLTTFADENDVQVLRRNDDGQQFAIRFRYSSVTKGKQLDSNIFLKSGDVIVVP